MNKAKYIITAENNQNEIMDEIIKYESKTAEEAAEQLSKKYANNKEVEVYIWVINETSAANWNPSVGVDFGKRESWK